MATRHERRQHDQRVKSLMRDLELATRQRRSLLDAETTSDSDSGSESEPVELVAARYQPRDCRPARGRKLNRNRRERRDPLEGYEPIVVSEPRFTPGELSKGRARLRARGQDGDWWADLYTARPGALSWSSRYRDEVHEWYLEYLDELREWELEEQARRRLLENDD